MDAPAIETVGLTRRFGDVVAVDGLDLTIARGELFALLGPNGAGKTTTIRMLCCLTEPSEGSARVMGCDTRQDPIGVKHVIAVSPQETAIAEHLDARENLELIAGLHGIERAEARRRADELLDLLGLADRGRDRVRTFSGGMKRRLSIAMALVADPDVLFLDEPTLGLDPQSRRAIWEHVRGFRQEKTIVLTTHYLEEADALADRVGIIDDGRLVALGTPAELKRRVGGGDVTVVETHGMTDAALRALREVYPGATTVDGRVEIDADDVDVYVVNDCLRPLGVTVDAVFRRTVSLDDVFLELTGKELRA